MHRLLILLFLLGCASAPPSVKIIEQVTKNEDAIDDVEESDMPENTKARVVSAIKDTQKLAVDASQAWEQCKVNLSDEREGFWQWLAICSGATLLIGLAGGFFIVRGFYKK